VVEREPSDRLVSIGGGSMALGGGKVGTGGALGEYERDSCVRDWERF